MSIQGDSPIPQFTPQTSAEQVGTSGAPAGTGRAEHSETLRKTEMTEPSVPSEKSTDTQRCFSGLCSLLGGMSLGKEGIRGMVMGAYKQVANAVSEYASTLVSPKGMAKMTGMAPAAMRLMQGRVSEEVGQNTVINKLGIGDPAALRKQLEGVLQGKDFKLNSSIYSMNTRIFGGEKGVVGEHIDAAALKIDLDLQKKNVKLAIVKGAVSKNLSEEQLAPLKELSDLFDQLADLYEKVGTREGAASMSKEDMAAVKEQVDQLKEKIAGLKSKIPNFPEGKMAFAAVNGAANKLSNNLGEKIG